jgi:hypothetical protein
MSKITLLAAVVLGAACLATGSAVAQATGSPAALDDDLGSMNLFISPCGEPFTAPKTEAYPIVKWFKKADANSDGKLDIDEFRADATAFFAVLDQNHDGVISSQEINYYEQTMVPVILHSASRETGIVRVMLQRGVDPIVPGGAQPGEDNVYTQKLNGNQGAVPFSLLREPEPVRSADRNFDYHVTLAEFQAHSDRHFNTLDVNHQGYLTLAELPKTQAEIAAKAHR